MPTQTANIRKLLIGGNWLATNETLTVRSPFDGAEVAEVAWGNQRHALAAIDASQQAMADPLATHERARILDEVADRLRSRKAEFAETICREAGKPITAAEVEVDRAIQTLVFSASTARTFQSETIDLGAHPAGEGRVGIVFRVPLGIAAAITPFNFPLNLVAHKVGPAFSAGCAVVLKPADKTPLSAILLGELFMEAGTPPGWINVVIGDAREIAGVFVQDERVKVISFTGSAEIGWKLRASAPKKKVLLELGNSTPLIVFADADLDQASSVITTHGFGFAGQTCISIQRVIVEQSVHDKLVAKLIPRINQLIVGNPLDRNTQVGPVITQMSRDRLLAWITAAEQQGAKILTGGSLNEQGLLRPTLLTNVTQDMAVSCQEVFGPVVSVMPVAGWVEAVSLANATPFGLQAGVFTSDIARALKAVPSLEFGAVSINESPSFRADQMPYGGIKSSGNTREGPQYAFREYAEPRLAILKLPNA